MSKDIKSIVPQAQEQAAFEMIELSIGGLEVLTRAFEVIEEVCRETQTPQVALEESPPKALIN